MAVLFPVTRERTWYSRGNISLPDNSSADLIRKSWVFILKNLLIGAETGGTIDVTRPASTHWTVINSSDGVTSGASDLWGTTFDASKIVFYPGGAGAVSWIVLRSPAASGSMYCLIHPGSSGSGQHVSFSTSAPTGGGATSLPTITANSMGWHPSGAGSYTNSIVMGASLGDSTTTANLAHFAVNTLGGFHFAVSRTAASPGRFHMYGMYDVAADTQVGDVFPYWCGYYSTVAGADSKGTPRYDSFSVQSRNHDGTYVSNAMGNPWNTYFVGGGGTSLMSYEQIDYLANTYWAMPVSLFRFHSNANLSTFSGRIPDFYMARGGASVGASVPNSSTPLYHLVGHYIVPFGVIPTLAGGSKGNASFSVPKLVNTQYPAATPPTVTVVSPAVGNIASTDSLVVDVTDPDGFTELIVTAYFASSGAKEVVHDGTSFSTAYATNSTRTAIANGYRYSIKRYSSWPSSPTLRFAPVDTLGAGST